jgi:anaerobic selenocysteine-containing dehydrogenase
MLNTIIEEGLYDKDFVEKYTYGFDKLVEHVKKYRPEFMADIAGVPASSLRETARVFAQSKPTAVLRFLGGFETTTPGFEAHRAVDILCAITGNVDNEGGNIIPEPHSGSLINASYKYLGPAIGSDYHPIFPRLAHNAVGACFSDAILNSDPYPLKGMIVAAANPALMHVNSLRYEEAWKRLDFLVQIDIRFNETSEFADIFLPAQALLEKNDLGSFYGALDNDMLGLIERVLPPPGESRPDHEIWWGIGERLGFEVPKSYEEFVNSTILKPLKMTMDGLRDEPYYYRKEFQKYKKRGGFKTPSGKFEIYSSYLEKRGFHPLPTYVEPPESPISTPSLFLKYPLIAIDFRVPHYFHTRFRECSDLRKLSPDPELEINPKDAEKYGIADGDMVIMESLRGRIELKAKLTENIKEGVVGTEAGWPNPANYNRLTADDIHQRDPVLGGAMFRGFLCRVSKAST